MLNRTQLMHFIDVLNLPSYSNEGRKGIKCYYSLTNKPSGKHPIQLKNAPMVLQSWIGGFTVSCGSGHIATQMVAELILWNRRCMISGKVVQKMKEGVKMCGNSQLLYVIDNFKTYLLYLLGQLVESKQTLWSNSQWIKNKFLIYYKHCSMTSTQST